MKKILVSALLVIASSAVFTQNFEGTIMFGIEYVDLPDELAAYESMMPKEMSYKFKDDMAKMIQPSAMGQTVMIHNGKTDKTTMLMDLMGSKYVMDTDNTKKKDETVKPTVTVLDETKEIAGYKCQKAEITMITDDGEEQKLTVYYTKDIMVENFGQTDIEGLDGFPLEYEMEKEGTIMKLTAKEVKKEKVSKAEFDIPKDYQTVTEEELKAMFGGK